jgi:hypothetical protein
MTERQEVTAYWLVPSDQDAARYQAVIDRLAEDQGAPKFDAHVSFGSVTGEEPALGAILNELRGLTLSPSEIARSPSFTMSLFVRFEPIQQLLSARSLLESCPGFQTSRTFDPHLSLCYGAPKRPEALKFEIEALLETLVRFDRLVAMSILLPVETHADVARWKQRAVYDIPTRG